MKINSLLFCLFLSVFLVSCGPVKRIFGGKDASSEEKRAQRNSSEEIYENTSGGVNGAEKHYANPVEGYIATYAPVAQQEMLLYKIPASITLAQGILESGAGRSELTRKANNHFGIKCHDWEGGSVYHDDDKKDECFRKYKDPKYSFRDHSLFLTERKRYAALFELDPDDYKSWARGLRKAGYATDRKYPEKLISIIERYQLYKFDAEVLGKDVVIAKRGSTSEKYIVQRGDTLYAISQRYNLTVQQLQEYNNLRGSTISVGQVLFLEPIPNN